MQLRKVEAADCPQRVCSRALSNTIHTPGIHHLSNGMWYAFPRNAFSFGNVTSFAMQIMGVCNGKSQFRIISTRTFAPATSFDKAAIPP